MSHLSGHLGAFGSFLGDDPTGGSADPNSPVIALTTDSTVLPTTPPAPLATDSAQPVPITPSDPMQASPPVALAVVDPNTILPPAAPVVTVVPTPKSNTNKIAIMVGVGVLGLYLLSRHTSGSKTKSAGRKHHHRRSSGRHRRHA